MQRDVFGIIRSGDLKSLVGQSLPPIEGGGKVEKNKRRVREEEEEV